MLDLKLTRLSLAVTLVGLATSCAVTSPQEINARYQDVIDQRLSSYRVKPGDQLTVRIYDQTGDLSAQTLTILPDGRADPFFMSHFKFAGKSLPEVESAVAGHLRLTEIQDPEVSLLLSPGLESVFLNGQVTRPGAMELTPQMTLGDALAAAGRDTTYSDSDYVILRRPYRDPLHPEIFRIDINNAEEDIYLLPKDEIYIPANAAATFVIYLRDYVFGVFPFVGYFAGALF
ncbi:MAG: polysaccharide biosynthesis/export family protein [Planctomycetota bacterium]|nr:polysaccharide biosynthesis/export family protein [Planctomycetota bacterium]